MGQVLLVILIFVLDPIEIQGQQLPPGWSAPVNISMTATQSNTPTLAADPEGHLHVVWSEEVEQGQGQLLYSHWSPQDGWSPPLDVVLQPGGGVPVFPVLACGPDGTLSLIWVGNGTVFYSKAYAPQAYSANSWTKPLNLIPAQPDIGMIDMAVDAKGYVHIVFAKKIGDGSGIYYVRSKDGGESWEPIVAVYENLSPDHMVDKPRVAVDSEGKIHVVWVEYDFPETFPPTGIRYADSDNAVDWSDPVNLSDGPYDDSGIIALNDGEVHVVWSGTSPDRYNFHRWSADGGISWREIYRDTELGGFTGKPALVSDAKSNLHWLQVGTIFANQNATKLHYQVWSHAESRWLPGTALLGTTSSPGGHARNPSAVVVLGNQLHVVMETPFDTESGVQTEIYYFRRRLDAPELAATPLPESRDAAPVPDVQKGTTTASSDSSVGPSMPASSSCCKDEAQQDSRRTATQSMILAIGIAPTIVFVVATLIVSRLGRVRRSR